ncbi:two-component system, sensor histidine kinase [Phycisphaerales bacterium]|nr:two-component system, sensor histidine kinase [Phycisphaerales bacterium]
MNPTEIGRGDGVVHARARELLAEDLRRSRCSTDRLFVVLLAVQWPGAILAAVFITPRAWTGATSTIHLHVWSAIVLGGLLTLFPTVLAILAPGASVTRHCIGAAQVLYSSLLIHATGGRIETHFHVFGSLAFLAFYRDWRVLVTATLIVAADHWLRGALWPRSVFGVTYAQPWRWLEHAGWVAFEDTVLLLSVFRGLREAGSVAHARAEIEANAATVEGQVRERTAELEVARAQSEASNRAKSEFLANMSHEIRTPMTAIIGYADLLQDPALSAGERGEHVLTIRRNGEHLVNVINDILDISKIEAGRMTLAAAPCRVCQIVAEVAALMRVRALGKNVTLEVEYVFPVPEVIRTDELRVRQILMNLVGNAVKFTEAGEVRVVVRSEGVEAPMPFVSIEVTDSGIGMTEEEVGRLFQPFTQLDSSQTRRFGGTGLGLAISKRLAQALEGDISVVSDPGKGSTFSLRLPTGDLSGVRMIRGAREAIACAETENTEPLPALTGKVLLAEDGPDNQRLIAFHLRKAGACVEVVENGRDAVERARAAAKAGDPFGVVLMDMQMPIMDGYTATRELRRGGYAYPIIALTAHAMTGDREKCLKAGCDDYHSKPIAPGELIRLTHRLMAAGRGTVGMRRAA